jgi:class 3 adenylate cyclase
MYHGAAAAVEYAARNPERVTRLVLAHPIVDGAAMQEQTRRWDSLRAMAAEEWEEYTLTMAATAVGYNRPDVLQLLAQRFREAMSPPAVQRMYEDLGGVDVRGSLSMLTMPVLLIYREHGIKFPLLTDVQGTASDIPNCEFVHTQGALGEFWTQEETDAVERFLGVTSAAPTNPRPTPVTPRPSGGLQTIVFTDIEANTELLQRVGDAAWREILREHERTTRALLAEYGGTEIKTIGDAFMTSFNSASAAIDCAIALQREFRHDAAQLHAPLRIRIGINAGEPIAEHDPAGRGDLFGTAVTTASRVQAMAKGGEILVTDVVRQLVAGKGFLFDDRGEHTLRGFEDPVRIFAVRTGD